MTEVYMKPKYLIINGIRFPHMFKPEHINEAMNYKPTSDDLFIVTYPKCGTTWMQNIVFYIFRKGKKLEDPKDFRRMCPFIDPQGLQGIVNMARPGAFKTHLPYNLMPYSPDAKYIFVIRNPKDVCVSLFYHTKYGNHGYSEGNFADFFELFMNGESEYSDYFDHLASWYPHRNDEQVFYTTYEDMKEEPRSVVLSVATFLGQEYIEAIEKDESVLNNILKFTGFDYLKKQYTALDGSGPAKENDNANEVNQSATSGSPSNSDKKKRGFGISHFRKGIVGDWKNHFTEEQSERLNQKFFERFGGTEIYEKYKSYM